MKLARYEHNGHALLGVVRKGQVHDLDARLDVLDVLGLPRPERDALDASAGRHHRIPLEQARLLPAIEPRAMRDFVGFERHIGGMKKAEPGDGSIPAAWFEFPVFLFMNPWALVGAHDEVPIPADTAALDFELELACIVGRSARNVSVEDAASHIAGYAIMNDWSARDLVAKELTVGLGPSKGKDFATTLGPWITTADELDDRIVDGKLSLEMSVSVNGVEIGRDDSANMSWTFAQMVSHASRSAVVGAGDVLASGTCSAGSLAELWARRGERTPPPLVPGDVVTMQIERLGAISNRIGVAEQLPPRPPTRERPADDPRSADHERVPA